jgi:peptidoglycan-associated lipoprotein
MHKKLWVVLALLVIVPSLLFTVACAKKAVTSDTEMTQTTDDQAAMEAKAAEEKAAAEEAARQAELDRQRQMEEQRLAEEAKRQAMAARDMFMSENVYFDFDSSTLLPAAQEVLKRKAAWMQENADASVIIEGHCDERGTEAYNLALGERRAESAKAFLVDLGIDATRLATISYGEERPVAMGHNEEAWAKNRRCEFVIE